MSRTEVELNDYLIMVSKNLGVTYVEAAERYIQTCLKSPSMDSNITRVKYILDKVTILTPIEKEYLKLKYS